MITVDRLNTFLILFSVLLAYFLPFELFLLSYAILGPLHYLTEINWIKKKSYFVSSRGWLPICSALTLLVFIPSILKISSVKAQLSGTFLETILLFIQEYSNIAIYMCLAMAVIFIFLTEQRRQLLVAFIVFLIGILLVRHESFNVWVGILLPTIVHVYLFTLLLMWYGSIKESSRIGMQNVLLMLLIPICILWMPYGFVFNSIQNLVKEIYVDTKFYMLNVTLSKLLHFSDGTVFNFSDITVRKIQMFISFAYTYHYLNWFSKTNTIGWTKGINKIKLLTIGFIWLLSVGVFFVNYQLGVIALLLLSFAHVFLEFPINIISIKGIIQYYSDKVKGLK